MGAFGRRGREKKYYNYILRVKNMTIGLKTRGAIKIGSIDKK